MLRKTTLSFTPASVNDSFGDDNYDFDRFAANVTGDTFTLTNTTTGDNLAHKVSVLNNSATDHSGKTLTFTGTDENNNALVESISGPGPVEVVKTTNYFKTLVSVKISASIEADTFDIGISAEFTSKTFPSGCYFGNLNFGTSVTGTIDYSIDHTFNDVQTEPLVDWQWLNNGMDGLTEPVSGNFDTLRPKAIRFRTNNYDTGATASIIIGQSYH